MMRALRRSKRESDGQFLAARRAARQQHVRDIQARNHENDTGQRQHQARQHLHSNVGGRRRARTDTRQWIRGQGLVLVLCGVRGLELTGQGVEPSCEHGVTEARLQTAGEDQAIVRPIGQLPVVAPLRIRNDRVEDSKREIDICGQQRHRPGESLRRDADDREVPGIDLDRPADECRDRAVLAASVRRWRWRRESRRRDVPRRP